MSHWEETPGVDADYAGGTIDPFWAVNVLGSPEWTGECLQEEDVRVSLLDRIFEKQTMDGLNLDSLALSQIITN